MLFVDDSTPSPQLKFWRRLVEKILLDQKLADFGMKLFDMRFVTLLVLLGFAGKTSNDLIFGLLLPLGCLIRVNAILAG